MISFKAVRAGLFLWLALWATPAIFAQETPAHATQESKAAQNDAEGGKWTYWMWANFAVLVGGLGYLTVKSLGPYYRSRHEGIQKGIAEAGEQKRSAESNLAEIEKRLASIDREVAQLRESSGAEFAAEADRIRRDTEQQLARLQRQTEQEIAAMGKHARQELKAYAAALAIDLAEQRVRSRMSPDTEERLVHSFIQGADGARGINA